MIVYIEKSQGIYRLRCLVGPLHWFAPAPAISRMVMCSFGAVIMPQAICGPLNCTNSMMCDVWADHYMQHPGHVGWRQWGEPVKWVSCWMGNGCAWVMSTPPDFCVSFSHRAGRISRQNRLGQAPPSGGSGTALFEANGTNNWEE